MDSCKAHTRSKANGTCVFFLKVCETSDVAASVIPKEKTPDDCNIESKRDGGSKKFDLTGDASDNDKRLTDVVPSEEM
jgi:hypothetical protein